jgi:hypothetical protein
MNIEVSIYSEYLYERAIFKNLCPITFIHKAKPLNPFSKSKHPYQNKPTKKSPLNNFSELFQKEILAIILVKLLRLLRVLCRLYLSNR